MKYICIIPFILLTIAGKGQEKKWTLQECMQYAIENSPSINKQKAQNSSTDQSYKEAVAALLPSLNAGTDAAFRFGRGLDAQTNTYININSFSNSYSIATALTLFDGLANVNKVRIQKMNRLTGKQQLQQTKDLIAYETMKAFFNVLYYKELVKLAEQQLEESITSLTQIQRMEELGIKGFPDVAEIKAKEASDRFELTSQKNQLVIGLILLKEKMNFPIDENIDITDNYQTDDEIIKSPETAFGIYEQSLSYLPKALIAQSMLRSSQLSYKASKGSILPRLSAEAGYSTNFSRYMDGSEYQPFADQLKDKRGHYIGINLSIPIFNGFSRSVQMKKSKYAAEISKNEQDETLRAIYSEIEQAVADMNGQVDEYNQATQQEKAMEIAHNVNQQKYKEGLISPIELYTSSNRLFKAKVFTLNARLKYYLKTKLVNYYKGEPYINQ